MTYVSYLSKSSTAAGDTQPEQIASGGKPEKGSAAPVAVVDTPGTLRFAKAGRQRNRAL
jgi:hypothetical protein